MTERRAGGAPSAPRGAGVPERRPNRLLKEKSPYLQQHAYNPVDWRPWGDEAFAEAKRRDVPLFLSIGYSTCHWCHVMEHESFEDERVAALLNTYFVPVKVDREERPDVDRVYMTAMQAMGMGGGWPLNVFLTPALAPFYGGTYFPPETRQGQPGMMQLLPHVHKAWTEQRADLEENGRRIFEALEGLARSAGDAAAAPFTALYDGAFAALEHSFDARHGGFGGRPKFPTVVNLNFLLREAARSEGRDPGRARAARAMAFAQLDAMRRGGIHDHLGGGFHRYAVDERWLVPHFEKMLYDQAQIAIACLEAWRVGGREDDAATARGIFDYVARDLTGAHGGFLSAEDADSPGPDGRTTEGAFYVWTPEDLAAGLTTGDAALFARRYGVTAEGNFEHTGASVLHEAEPLAQVAGAFGIPEEEAASRLALARGRLFDERAKRPRPHRDDKVIAAWNGLMIRAFAFGATTLGDPALETRAAAAAEFAWSSLYDPGRGELKRRWREGEAAAAGQLDDYAFLAHGLLALFEANAQPLWLDRAVHLAEAMIARFADNEGGGFFESPAGDPSVRVRMKDGFDGAEMAGNSIAALVLVELGELTDRADFRSRATSTLEHYARRLGAQPLAMPQMLVAMQRAEAGARHVVIAAPGTGEDPTAAAMAREFHRGFRPNDLLVRVDERPQRARVAALAPWIGPLSARGGQATAYVCVDRVCRAPAQTVEEFAAALRTAGGS
jgi:uncharacterized protein YyaL (SSP411 family)